MQVIEPKRKAKDPRLALTSPKYSLVRDIPTASSLTHNNDTPNALERCRFHTHPEPHHEQLEHHRLC